MQTSAVKFIQWNHVAVTVYQKNVAIYVNGKLIASATLQGAINDGSGSVLVGQVFLGKSVSRIRHDETHVYTGT